MTKTKVKAKLTSDAESKNKPSTNTRMTAIGATEAPLVESKTTTKSTPTMMTKTMRAMDESTERGKDGRSSFRSADNLRGRKSREIEAEEREKVQRNCACDAYARLVMYQSNSLYVMERISISSSKLADKIWINLQVEI